MYIQMAWASPWSTRVSASLVEPCAPGEPPLFYEPLLLLKLAVSAIERWLLDWTDCLWLSCCARCHFESNLCHRLVVASTTRTRYTIHFVIAQEIEPSLLLTSLIRMIAISLSTEWVTASSCSLQNGQRPFVVKQADQEQTDALQCCSGWLLEFFAEGSRREAAT